MAAALEVRIVSTLSTSIASIGQTKLYAAINLTSTAMNNGRIPQFMTTAPSNHRGVNFPFKLWVSVSPKSNISS